jgi:hypothetical protein
MKKNNAGAEQRSLDMLRNCLTPSGFGASSSNVDNYARVWARDGIIAGFFSLSLLFSFRFSS